MTTFERVGFIGLGGMGRGLVKNLVAKGVSVTAYDLDPAAVAVARSSGATAGSLQENRDNCRIVMMCVNEAEDVEALLRCSDAIISAAGGRSGMLDLYDQLRETEPVLGRERKPLAPRRDIGEGDIVVNELEADGVAERTDVGQATLDGDFTPLMSLANARKAVRYYARWLEEAGACPGLLQRRCTRPTGRRRCRGMTASPVPPSSRPMRP